MTNYILYLLSVSMAIVKNACKVHPLCCLALRCTGVVVGLTAIGRPDTGPREVNDEGVRAAPVASTVLAASPFTSTSMRRDPQLIHHHADWRMKRLVEEVMHFTPEDGSAVQHRCPRPLNIRILNFNFFKATPVHVEIPISCILRKG
jgi:hypothetical protein